MEFRVHKSFCLSLFLFQSCSKSLKRITFYVNWILFLLRFFFFFSLLFIAHCISIFIQLESIHIEWGVWPAFDTPYKTIHNLLIRISNTCLNVCNIIQFSIGSIYTASAFKLQTIKIGSFVCLGGFSPSSFCFLYSIMFFFSRMGHTFSRFKAGLGNKVRA